MDKIKVAALQVDVSFGNSESNQGRLLQMMAESLRENPQIILAPEMWNLGYDLEKVGESGDREGQMVTSLMAPFARAHGVHIVAGSVADVRKGQVFNASYVFNPQGECVGQYSKIHLFRLMAEEKYLAPGQKRFIFDLDGHKAGVIICYDLRFPELIRSLALDGVEILFVPAEWPHPRLHHWRTLIMARAIENQMFVVACNRVGTDPKNTFFGHSVIVDPWGEVLAEGSEQEEIVTAELDLNLVTEVRGRIKVFEDRREETYR